MSTMRCGTMRVLGILCALGMLAAGAEAQDVYKNSQYGFQLKPPRGWTAVPPQPGEKLMVVKFNGDREYRARREAIVGTPEMEILVFSTARGAVTGGDAESEREEALRRAGYGTPRRFEDWLKQKFGDEVQHNQDPKERTINKAEAVEYDITTDRGYRVPARFRIYVFEERGHEVVLVFHIMEEWAKKVVPDFYRCAKTFKWIEAESPADKEGEELSPDQQHLQMAIDSLPPSWTSTWSKKKRYVILTDLEDKGFMNELNTHLEAMRDHYEEVFPPTEPITAVSIVRVCKDDDTYHAYGGRPGTGGYWASSQKELVLFANKEYRSEILAVVSHEAFHQYIYYFYGELAPHSWYNEGHGDYFGGAKMSGSGKKVMRIEPMEIGRYQRLSRIREALRVEKTIPLAEFMNYSQQQNYGYAYGYPQGWSIVYFLREGKGKVKSKWRDMLDEYLVNLVEARDEMNQDAAAPWSNRDRIQKKAYEKTFEDWSSEDWEEFESAWKAFYID